MTTFTDPPPDPKKIEQFEEETVEQDLACTRCGHNLRGLEITGTCPECGLAIRYSQRGDLLRLADPAWVARLSEGCRGMHWAVMFFFYVVALGLLCWVVGPDWWLLHGVEMVSAVALMGGVWAAYRRIMSPEPRGRGAQGLVTGLRLLGHAAALASLAAAGVALFGGDEWRFLGVAGAVVLAALVLVWLAILRLQPLARRIPENALTYSAAWWLVASLVFDAAVLYVLFLLHQGPPSQTSPLIDTDSPLAMAALLMTPLVLQLWAVAIFWTYAKAFSTVIHGPLADLDDTAKAHEEPSATTR